MRTRKHTTDTLMPKARLVPLWSPQDASDYLGVPVATLYQWRYRGIGPRSFRVGRHLRYDPDHVRQWLDEQTA
jgi:predicted DNA-binding transcriptional regulator AlpA